MSLHVPAGACIPVASVSPIHVPPVQRVLKHCGAHKHIYRTLQRHMAMLSKSSQTFKNIKVQPVQSNLSETSMCKTIIILQLFDIRNYAIMPTFPIYISLIPNGFAM